MRGAAVAETVQQPTPVTTGDTLLSLDDVTLKFGGVTALNGVSLHIDRGEILGLIGPNGAGKTTAFNVVTGIYRPPAGGVAFDAEQSTGLTHDRPDLGAPRAAAAPARGGRGPRARARAARLRRGRRPRRRAGGQPLLRRPAPAGDRARNGDPAEAALPGRARRGLQPVGEAGA